MNEQYVGAESPTLRSFVSALLVASSGVIYSAMSVWSVNFAQLSPLRLVQLVAFEVVFCACVLAVVAWRRGNLTVSAVTLSLGGLLLGSGDAVARRIGTFQSWVIFVFVLAACIVLLRRMASANTRSLRVLAMWLSLFLLLQPVLSVIFDGEISPSRITATPPIVTTDTGSLQDFVLIVLDGYASIATLRDQFSFDSPLESLLTGEGFEVVEAAWAPSTRSVFSISSLVNLGPPLASYGATGGDIAVLFDMIRGDARLFSMFREAGYGLTYIESGWVGSVCGEEVDSCTRRPFVDEAVQTVLDRSLLSNFATSWWGHAFALGGLRSFGELERMMGDIGTNGANDIVFAHVLLPHSPYVLGSDCGATGTRVDEPEDAGFQAEIPRAAYLEQVKCVDRWLARLAANFPPSAAVVLTSDHGSLFRGQMSRHPDSWSAEDIAERSQVLLATKLPTSCTSNRGVAGPLEAVMDASDCLLNTRIDRTATETLWLFSNEVVPRCIELPGKDLAIVDVPC